MGKFTDTIIQDLAEIKAEVRYIKEQASEFNKSISPRLQSVEDDVKFAKRTSKLLLTITGLFFGWLKLKN